METTAVGRKEISKSLKSLEEEKARVLTPLEKQLAELLEEESGVRATVAAISQDRARVEGELLNKRFDLNGKIGALKRKLSANPPESALKAIEELRAKMDVIAKTVDEKVEEARWSGARLITTNAPHVKAANARLGAAIRELLDTCLLPLWDEDFDAEVTRVKEAALADAEAILKRPCVENLIERPRQADIF